VDVFKIDHMRMRKTDSMSDGDSVRNQLRRWREELVDLSRKNRLLYFKHLRSGSLEFEQDADSVWRRLQMTGRAAGWGIFLPPHEADDEETLDLEISPRPHPRSDELVVAESLGKNRAGVEASLRSLRRKSHSEFMDAGLHVLYLGLGLLGWPEPGSNEPVRSPLYLLPVGLEHDPVAGSWRLVESADAEPAINPVLAAALDRHYGIRLPTLDELDDDNYVDAIEAVRRRVPERDAWTVDESVVLSTFSFHKHAIYRDLEENEDRIAAHDLVRLLVEGPTSGVLDAIEFAPVPEEHLDTEHPPEELVCIRDTDASQRQCVIAAQAGRSFVMSGPPGTGKSQTIANSIAQLLHDGKTVLFVSEKAAALDVVLKRLAELHLDEFVLELHSHKATRKAVAQELGAALARKPFALAGVSTEDRDRVAELRRHLTDHAIAVNEVRQPLGRSVHDIIGEIVSIDSFPVGELATLDASDMSAGRLHEMVEQAERLSENWAPIEHGSAFVWRDMVPEAASRASVVRCRTLVEDYRSSLAALQNLCEQIHAELHIVDVPAPDDIDWLSELIDLIEGRPSVSPDWLTASDLDAASESVERFAELVDALQRVEGDLSAWRPEWRELDPAASTQLLRAAATAEALDPPLSALRDRAMSELRDVRPALEAAAGHLESAREQASPLRDVFEARAEATVESLVTLADLGELAASESPPESDWFRGDRLRMASAAVSALEPLVTEWRQRAEDLKDTFKRSALDLELAGLRQRFQALHRGLRKLGSQYRSDKRELASVTLIGAVTDEVIERLDDAVQWQRLDQRLTHEIAHHANTLGEYWRGPDHTDFEQIGRAIGVADQAIERSGGTVSREGLARVLGRGSELAAVAVAAAERTADEIAQFRSCRLQAVERRAIGQLQRLAVPAAVKWCQDQNAVLGDIEAAVADVVTMAGSAITVSQAVAVLGQRTEHQRLETEVRESTEPLRELLAELAKTPQPESLREASTWVRKVRSHFATKIPGGDDDAALSPETAAAVTTTSLTPADLTHVFGRAKHSREQLLGLFQADYSNSIREGLAESFDSALELLDALASSVDEVEVWAHFVQSQHQLAQLGLEPVLELCRRRSVSAADIPHIVKHSVLRRWVEDVTDRDARLKQGVTFDRNRIRQEFQQLDRKLVELSASAVVNACAQRRPTSMAGGAGLIKREAQKARRHWPVRKLLDEAGDVAKRLKPCFMMSPLSVSQFLPADLSFDAVIFDEASQVTEADAVNCVYRGRQLIVAGDENQLPPTNFFAKLVDEDAEDAEDELVDFESILGRCKAQGLRELPLSWHYRSLHEDLITFSNRSFYKGGLQTFPSANFDAPDLGVEFFHVDGTYRRGTTRDNREEAAKVVERVLHHRRHHPNLTVGVVALSSVQQDAVERELERRARSEPELSGLLESDDRLSGLFVKNLETVQGDERDIIILTVGYGPDENGKLTMNFGPLNRKETGWRRLNVAVTRARHRVEVVASVSAGDIVSDNPSIDHLRRYLDYAERGPRALALEAAGSLGDVESPFEAEVLAAVRQMGYEADPQVGVAGYRVDIGVRHPDHPGAYVLGIECDGASYHSSKVARDRDRLRQDVLEGLGWTIYRIWSTAWFTNRPAEMTKLREAIERAIEASSVATPSNVHPDDVVDRARRAAFERSTTDASAHLTDRDSSAAAGATPADAAQHRDDAVQVHFNEVDFDAAPGWAVEYDNPEAPRPLESGWEFQDPASRSVIADQVLHVVNMHTPIHREDVLRAVREAWGLQRAGSRIREAFDEALHEAGIEGRIEMRGEWLSNGGAEIDVRVPTSSEAPRRGVARVPPEELQLAICRILEDAGPCDPEDLCKEWARVYGWKRVGPDISDAFDQSVRSLRDAGVVIGQNPLRLAGKQAED
jgi:very-short-patch-repair endonuclease